MATKLNLERSGPPLTREEISVFEQEIGAQLPEDYRRFILRHNGGVTGLTGAFIGFSWERRLQTLWGFYRLLPTRDEGLRRALRELRELKTDGFVPVASTSNDEEICLAVCAKDAGAVFFTVYKYKAVYRGDLVPIAVTMAPLAGSFTEFLDMLVEIPDPYCRIEDLGKQGTPDDLAQYLAKGNSIDAVGKNDLTIVCEAIKFNNLPMIQACIERGASLSGTIHRAVGNQRTELIQMLVDAGADINEEDETGTTPLYYVGGTALPGEEGARNRELEALLVKLGAVKRSKRERRIYWGPRIDDSGRPVDNR